MITIRTLAPTDRADWDRLYAGYAEFYQVAQTAEMRDRVWGWLMDDAHGSEGLVADRDGTIIGIAHFRSYFRPLAASVGGFLDDLFVDPAARRSGAAEALIAALKVEARRRGWTVIRWITAENNYRARKLYDRVAERTAWVTYDIKL